MAIDVAAFQKRLDEVSEYKGVPYGRVHLIFEAALRPESIGAEPRVLEVDSSTAEARWWPAEEARELPLLSAARHALGLVW